MAGAKDLLQKLPAILGDGVRVLAAPCIGRCEQAPAAVVGQHPVACASIAKVAALVSDDNLTHPPASDRSAFDPADFHPAAQLTGHDH